MPKVMWQLALVYLFSGMPYSAIGKTPQSIALSVWNTPKVILLLMKKLLVGPDL
jgi:hypothetical protein